MSSTTANPPKDILFFGKPLPRSIFLDYEFEPSRLSSRTISTGGYGNISICARKGDPSFVVAIKTMRSSDDEMECEKIDRMLEKEITPLMLCSHRNILEYLGLIRGNPEIQLGMGIVCRYAVNRSLGTYLKKNPGANRVRILRDVAAGLAYLHSPNPHIYVEGKKIAIVHGDVHPGNVLIMGDGTAVLSDFGLCKIAETAALTSQTVRVNGTAGVEAYIGPEVHDPKDFLLFEPEVKQHPAYAGRRTAKTDVFAFGMLIFAAFGGDPTSSIGCRKQTAFAIIKGLRPQRADVQHPAFTEALWMLACECWQGDAAKRPVMTDVLARL